MISVGQREVDKRTSLDVFLSFLVLFHKSPVLALTPGSSFQPSKLGC